jgi:hypothetical protein
MGYAREWDDSAIMVRGLFLRNNYGQVHLLEKMARRGISFLTMEILALMFFLG